jgi:hypothetical protein
MPVKVAGISGENILGEELNSSHFEFTEGQ